MREIKFKGKRIDNGEWVYGYYVVESPPLQCIGEVKPDKHCIAFAGFADWNMPRMYIVEVDPKTVGQYTGLKDKAGKEVYEGDIVKCTELSEDKLIEYISEVFWKDYCYLVSESKLCDVELGTFGGPENKYPLTEIEVLGNIYENQELLEVV